MSHSKGSPFRDRKKNVLFGLLPETRASANKYRRGEQEKKEVNKEPALSVFRMGPDSSRNNTETQKGKTS